MGGTNSSKMSRQRRTQSRQNIPQSFVLVWLDSMVNESEENREAQERLQESFSVVKIFELPQPCEDYIQTLANTVRIILIVSGHLGQAFVTRIHNIGKIRSIYIYCMNRAKHENWSKNFGKIKGIFTHVVDLIETINIDQCWLERHIEPLSVKILQMDDRDQQSSRKLDGGFLHFQLLVDALIDIPASPNEKQELLNLWRNEFQDQNTLKVIDEFERTYSPDQCLLWYTKETFVYRMLNKALRVENTDLLLAFYFFIRDINMQLKKLQFEQPLTPIHVYRGQLLSVDEFSALKAAITRDGLPGQLVCMNSFLSASFDRRLAMMYAGDGEPTGDKHGVLFEIEADPNIIGVRPFADIQTRSNAPDELEVLFSLGTIFRVMSIRQEAGLNIIQLVLATQNDQDMKMFQLTVNHFIDKMKNRLIRLSYLLEQSGQFEQAERLCKRALTALSKDTEDYSRCLIRLSISTNSCHKYKESVKWGRLAIDACADKGLYESLSPIFSNLGEAYKGLGDKKAALEAYHDALEIERVLDRNGIELAGCYHNIGGFYMKEFNFDKALEFFIKDLAITEKLSYNHPDQVSAHQSIAALYVRMRRFDLSLKHCRRALEISQQTLPSNHIQFACIYDVMGGAYLQKHDFEQALFYAEKARVIFRAVLPSSHKLVRDNEEIYQVAKFRIR